MEARKRSRLLLAGVSLVGFANGFFLALTLCALLTLLLHLVGASRPPLWAALAAGTVAGTAVLSIATLRERALARGESILPSCCSAESEGEGRWEEALARLAERSELERSPRLHFVAGAAPNAFATGSGENDAAIMLSDGLRELPRSQVRAVVAHELAHVEAADLRAVAFADMVQATVEDLGWAKGTLLWGPRRILVEAWPFIGVLVAMLVLYPLLMATEAAPGAGETFLSLGKILVGLGLAWLFLRVTFLCWPAILQLFVFCALDGWLSLVEAALAWPTSFALARLLSRQRVYAADARAVELTGEPEALAWALEAVRWIERQPGDQRYDRLRFSLFARPRPQSGYLALVERVVGTHPSAEHRIERVRERAAQERSRSVGLERVATGSLEQSG